MPYGTNITNLVANFTTTGDSTSVGSVKQTSGTSANDFTTSVVYRVTAIDGSYADYTVTVTVALNSARAITSYSILGVAASIDETAKTIILTVPYGTLKTSLVAGFSTTGASVKINGTDQISGTTSNDFTNPLKYTVTAADGSTAEYTVTVTVSAPVYAANPSFSLSAGWYSGTQSVTLSSATAGATIKYTTDGSDPAINGSAYSTAISITDTVKIRAVAVKSGMENSAVTEATYNIRRIIKAYTKQNSSVDVIVKVYDASGNEDTVNWNRTIDFSGKDDVCQSIAVDSNNNIYISGFNNYDSSGKGDGWIKKYSSNGYELTEGWSKIIPHISEDHGGPRCTVDSNNDVYIIGTDGFLSTGYVARIKKYSSNGIEITIGWDKSFISYSSGENIKTDLVNNRIYAVGWAPGGMFIKGYDLDGNILTGWDKIRSPEPTASSCGARGIEIDSDGSVFIGGFQAVNDRNAWFTKYDKDGIEINGWNKLYPDIDSSVWNFVIDKSHNVYVEGKKYTQEGVEIISGWGGVDAGLIDSNNNLYGLDFIMGNDGFYDAKLFKWDINGIKIWDRNSDFGSLVNDDFAFASVGLFR